MDTNDCGVPLQTGMDHSNPAAIRLLAEQADAKFQSMLDSLYGSYPDIMAWRLNSYTATYSTDNVLGYGASQFTTTGDSDFRPGVWMLGAQIGMNAIGAGTTWFRGSIIVKDYPPASIAATPLKTTQFARTGYKCGRPEERLNITGVVEIFNEFPDVDVYIAVGGGGPVTVVSALTWLWGVRIRGNS